MSRFPVLRASILSICVCCLFTGIVQYSPVIAGEGNKAGFADKSTCLATLLKNQEYFPALTRVIDEAQNEIIMSFFSFRAGVNKKAFPDIVLAHLAKAAKRGVRIIVILENSGGTDLKLDAVNSQTRDLLKAKGVEVHYDSSRIKTHTKLIVIDQELIILGSHNLTQSALKHNNEISIMLKQPDLAKDARNYMLGIIKDAK
jgi:HKD family nuclease